MLRSDEHWLSIVDMFSAAAMGAAKWPEALFGLAAATGSEGVQLVGFGPRSVENFMWVADPEDEWVHTIDDAGGSDAYFNPRLRAGLEAPVLALITDPDIISREERRRHPLYADFFDRYNRPYICATTLIRESNSHVGVAALRTSQQGEINDHQRAAFSSLAPHIRAALQTQKLLEGESAKLIAGTLEAVSITAFVCDRQGMVRAMTPTAEELIQDSSVLYLRHGQLAAASHTQSSRLAEAIGIVAGGLSKPGAPLPRTLALADAAGQSLALSVLPLPHRAFTLGFEPRALVVVRGLRQDLAATLQILQTACGLTATEAQIVLQLADGRTPAAIAAGRAVSLHTVRTQIKSIYAKLQVRRQVELIARINQLR